jgi:hypothetical protein
MIYPRRLLIPLILACIPINASPIPILRLAIKRIVPAAVATGALYFGFTTDGRKTRSTVWEAAQKINDHTTETSDKVHDLLETEFNEQKDEHSLMINTLAGVQKQAKTLKTQQDTTLEEVYEIKTQQDALLEKINTITIMLAALLQQKTDATTPAPALTTRGGIRIVTEEAGA